MSCSSWPSELMCRIRDKEPAGVGDIGQTLPAASHVGLFLRQALTGMLRRFEAWPMLVTPAVQLVIVDERPIVRAGVVACLRDSPDIRVEGDFATIAQCVAAGQEVDPAVVLVGYQHRGSLTHAIHELRRVHATVRVVLLSRCGG